MNKVNKDFEKWALKKMEKIQKALLLEDFAPLQIKYGVDQKGSHAECVFNYPYKSITVQYSDALLKEWLEKKFESVVGTLVHEMSHPITDPLYAKATTMWTSKSEMEDERERLTDHIANIVLKNKLI